MSDNTAIEWTDATVNFWWGCTKVGPGCDHCYAETWSKRTGESIWGAGVPRRKIKSAVATIYRLQNGASWWAADAEIGKFHSNSRRRVFVQSMSDLFDKEVPDEWFAEAWDATSACTSLDIQIVTKRVSFIEKCLNGRVWPSHAGLIISIVNQEEANRDIPRLIELKRRLGIPWIGLSMEPLLGPVILRPEWLAELDWVIVGGESGPGARPMHPDWARSLRDQCAAANVPFFFKQWGSWLPDKPFQRLERRGVMMDANGRRPTLADMPAIVADTFDFAEFHHFADVGKKAAGRLLDGREHSEFPA